MKKLIEMLARSLNKLSGRSAVENFGKGNRPIDSVKIILNYMYCKLFNFTRSPTLCIFYSCEFEKAEDATARPNVVVGWLWVRFLHETIIFYGTFKNLGNSALFKRLEKAVPSTAVYLFR